MSFSLEFVNVMQGSRGVYEKYINTTGTSGIGTITAKKTLTSNKKLIYFGYCSEQHNKQPINVE